MHEYDAQVENVSFRVFPNVARLDVSTENIHYVRGENINTLKVLHTHPFYEMFSQDSGVIKIKFADEYVQTVTPGDILIIPPGVEHVMVSERTEAYWPSLQISFTKKTGGTHDLYSGICGLFKNNCPVIICGKPELGYLASELVRSATDSESEYLAVMAADLLVRIMGLSPDNISVINKAGSLTGRKQIRDIDVNRKIENLIASRYMTKITAAEAASLIHVSVRQLDRTMKKFGGMTFRETVTLRRLTVAVELFKMKDMTIERISSEVGFESRMGFSDAFRKRYGMSPSKYRKLFCSGVDGAADSNKDKTSSGGKRQ